MSLKGLALYFAEVAVLVALCFYSGFFGVTFYPTSGFADMLNLPTAIAFAALFIFGIGLWPGVFLGSFLLSLRLGMPPPVAVGLGIGSTLEAVIGTHIFKRIQSPEQILETFKSVVYFIIFVVVGSTLISTLVSTASVWFGGIAFKDPYLIIFESWWISHMLGNLIVAPLLIIFIKKNLKIPNIKITTKTLFNLLVAVFLLLMIDLVVFSNFFKFDFKNNITTLYLLSILLTWIPLKLGQKGVSVTSFMLVFIAILGTINGLGPFVYGTEAKDFMTLQFSLAIISLVGMIEASIFTTRDRLTSALEERIARDEAILFSIGDGLIVVDKQNKIVMINKAFEDLLGWEKGTLIGKNMQEVIPAEDEKGSVIDLKKKVLSNLLSGKDTIVKSTWYFAKKNKTKFPALFVATPIVLKNEIAGIVEVFHDVTKEKELDKARNDFIFLVSHQLRTPLSSINWYVEMLFREKTGMLNDKQKEYLQTIGMSNDRMVKLINALLNVSRIEFGQLMLNPVPTDVRQLIEETIKEESYLVKEKELKVSIEEIDKIPKILIDVKLLQVVLQNLFSNAVKYTSAGGIITYSLKLTAKELEIQCKDTGMGIPPEQQSRVFEKFFRAHNAVAQQPEGTGLGLYITKAMVDVLGGKIQFQSVYGKGSTFTVTLPLQKATEIGAHNTINANKSYINAEHK